MAKQERGGLVGDRRGGSFVGATVGIIGMVRAAPLAMAASPRRPRLLRGGGAGLWPWPSGCRAGTWVKGLASAFLGLSIGLVGLDPVLGTPRLTGGIPELFDGIDLVAVIMGALRPERDARRPRAAWSGQQSHAKPDRPALPGRTGAASVAPMARGSIIGFFMGPPARVAGDRRHVRFLRHREAPVEVSRAPGVGAAEGVAGPETTNTPRTPPWSRCSLRAFRRR